MRNHIYCAQTDANGILTVQQFAIEEVDAGRIVADYAERYPEVIYFEVPTLPTVAAVRSVLNGNFNAVLDWMAESIVAMGAFESYAELEGAIVESLAELAGQFGLPRLNAANLDLYRAAADASGIDHDGDTIGGPR